jgi:hypothetical protein
LGGTIGYRIPTCGEGEKAGNREQGSGIRKTKTGDPEGASFALSGFSFLREFLDSGVYGAAFATV